MVTRSPITVNVLTLGSGPLMPPPEAGSPRRVTSLRSTVTDSMQMFLMTMSVNLRSSALASARASESPLMQSTVKVFACRRSPSSDSSAAATETPERASTTAARFATRRHHPFIFSSPEVTANPTLRLDRRLVKATIIGAMGTMQELRTTGAVERAARVDLAAAFRLAVRLDLHEGVCNHFSLMLPDGKRFLLNRYGLHWSEVTASNLLALDADGNVLEGEGEFEKTAFYIHSRIHLANPRAACVLHTHMPYATALTLIENGRLEMVEQNALRFHDDIAYDDTYNGLVVDHAEGDRLARVLGRKRVLFLANHGVIVIGPTVAEAFDSLYYLERACRLQGLARSMGAKLKQVRPEVVSETYRMILADTPKYAAAHFAALKRILDREEPDYSR